MFDELYGQERVKKVLEDSLSGGRLGHAYAFCGPKGIGRKSFARLFGMAAMCTGRDMSEGAEPCGKCTACILNSNGTNPDMVTVGPEEGKSTVSVDAVRELQEEMQKAPEYGRAKVCIIDRSESLTVQAQNALLKTIEEPPENVITVLICAQPEMLIDTVRSRVTRIDFARYSDEDVLRAFHDRTEASGTETDDSMVLAYADGIIGRGLEFTDFEQFGEIRSETAEFIDMVSQGNPSFMIFGGKMFEKYQKNKEFLFFCLCSYMRDAMIAARIGKNGNFQNPGLRDRLSSWAGRKGYHYWNRALGLVNEAWMRIGRNVNYRLCTDELCISLDRK